MDLKRVRHFLALSKTLNFTAAAAELGISQPALSKSVRKLENEFGGALLRREGKRTHLTPLGRSVIANLREFENAGRRLETEAQRVSGGSYQALEIAVMCTIGGKPLGRFLAKFREDHPQFVLILHDAAAAEIRDLVTSGMVDLALVGDPVGASPHLRRTSLYSEEMVVGLAEHHALTALASFELGDLERAPYVDRLSCELRDTILQSLNQDDLKLQIAASLEREDWMLELLSEGAGIAVLPESLIDCRGLVSRPFDNRRFRREVSLVVPVGREDNEAVRALIAQARKFDWLRAH